MNTLNTLLNKVLKVKLLSLTLSLFLKKITECFPFYQYRIRVIGTTGTSGSIISANLPIIVLSSTIPANLPTDAQDGK